MSLFSFFDKSIRFDGSVIQDCVVITSIAQYSHIPDIMLVSHSNGFVAIAGDRATLRYMAKEAGKKGYDCKVVKRERIDYAVTLYPAPLSL